MRTPLQSFATGVLLLSLVFLTGVGNTQAQSIYEPYSFDTLAGTALGSGSIDNTGALARLNQPWGLAVDGAGNVYVADTLNHTIRKITPAGAVTLLAGVPGSTGSANGASNTATFNRPTGVAVNGAGSVVYVADSNNHLIRQISGGFVTTVAGSGGVFGIDDGTGVSARFHNPFGVALDPAGAFLYVSDQNNQTIREIALPGGVVSTLAGSPGVNGYQDGASNLALFNTPRGIAVDGSGSLFVADAGNLTVRKIDLNMPGGNVSTLAGQLSTPGFTDGPGDAALFSALSGMSPFGGPCGVAVDGAGNVYVTDQGNHIIRKISPGGNVTTLAGVPLTSGGDNGLGNVARFNSPGGVAVDSAGELYVADTVNHTIRTGTDMMLTFGGINHGSVGNATLTTDSGALVVSGTGLDGPDGPGVDILPGWLSGFVLGVFYEIPEDDGTLVFTDFVDLSGETRQVAGTVTVERVGRNRRHSFDFSSIGASTYTLQIFNCSELVYESAGNSGHGFTTEVVLNAGTPSSAGWHVGDGNLGFSMTSPAAVAHHVEGAAGMQTVMGDRAVVIPENPTAEVLSSSGARIQFGRGISKLRILKGSLSNGESTFSAIGNARFEMGGTQLTLENPDPGEEIGVSITFGDACEAASEPGVSSIDWMQLPTDLQDGAFLETIWRGTVDGFPDTAIASMEAVVIGSSPGGPGGIALVTEFPALRPSSFRLEFYLDGNLVGEEVDQPIDQPLMADTSPTGNRLEGPIAIYLWDEDSPCIFDRWGNLFAADEVRVIPENPHDARISGRLSGTLVVFEIPLLTFTPRNRAGCVPGETWTPRASNQNWRGIASSSDGSKLAAVAYNGQIHTSDNFGVTWTLRETDRKWWDIAMSWDGNKLAAVANPGQIYISADSGVTWTARASTQNWQSVAMSWNGTNLVAVAFNDKIYTSTNSGVTWMARESDRTWRSVTMSWDGSNLAAVASPGKIYTSTDSGATWTPRDSTRDWWRIASSSNGVNLVAVEHLGRVYTSDNSGVTWMPRDTSRPWMGVASSWNGSKLAATAFGGQIYLSPDSGVTWMPQESSRHWDSIVMSSAGHKLAATTQGGKIYTSGCTVPPLVVCADDKTVNCSDPWSFDPPTVAAECSAATVTVLDTVSDGSCPETITRTWLVTNACGGDYACSQTVTVVNDNPPLFIAQQAYLKASNTDQGDRFGASVAVSDNTVVVGAYEEDSGATGVNGSQGNATGFGDSGAVYVFVRDGATWSQQAYLKASNPGGSLAAGAEGDSFGLSVALSGDTLVVGAPREDSNATGINGAQGDNSSGNSGAAYVFVRHGTTWIQQAYLKASNTGVGDNFGWSVAVSGDTIVVGAYLEDSNATGINGAQADNSAEKSGAAYVFVRNPSPFGPTWSQQAYLKASNTGGGLAVGGAGDHFGFSVAIANDTVVVGAYLEDSNATGINGAQADNSAGDSGAAYVFERNGTTWSQQAYLKASNTGAADEFAFSVAISNDTIVVGANGEDSSATGVNGDGTQNNATNAGAAYVFVRNGTAWSQEAYLKASNTRGGTWFGNAVAIFENQLLIGNSGEKGLSSGVNGDQSNLSPNSTGAAYAFVRNGTVWSQQAYLKTSNPRAHDLFGQSVAVSGDIAVVGGPWEDSKATGVNGDPTDLFAFDSGAAYIFTGIGPAFTASSFKTVSCTDEWDFDQPIVRDACSGELITPVIVGSVSSGSCPEVITRTWLATDACGNSNTYSQAVTVTTPLPQFTFFPLDKTVECGSGWSFDTPAAVIYCDEPPIFREVSTVTSGSSCNEVITRTWRITDHCGNFTECSQTVTVIDTTEPFIDCPTKTIIVALDNECRLVIPTIQPLAADACTPRSQLVYTQNPAAGTSFPDPCQRVTVTVTDACGNVSTCEVMVCGIDKTPPVLICPKSVTVTDCTVPDVLALVSAFDDCSPSNRLIFTQSPLPGTPIAAGGSQVSVTVTDQEGNSATCIIQLIPSGSDSFLDVLFNTGVDGGKVVLPVGSVDPHFTLDSVPAGTPTGPGAYNAPDAIVTSTIFSGLPPFTASNWIGPHATGLSAVGSFTYSYEFILPAAADPLTASISGRWAMVLGSANMSFNGSAAAVASIAAPGSSWWPLYNWNWPNVTWSNFTINSGFLGFPAVNNLTFVVAATHVSGFYNEYGPLSIPSLRVEFTDAFANCHTCTPPVVLQKPRPRSLPLNSTAVFNVNVSGTPPFSIQWYHNNVPLSNGGHYSGVNTATLTVTPLAYADAGMYHAVISNPCGEIAGPPAQLTIHKGWPWWWSRWDFDPIGKPLTATVGLDLIVVGDDFPGLSSGTTLDFNLPNIGGKPGTVMYVPALPAGTFIRLPFPEPPDDEPVDGYTLVADINLRDAPGRSTIFTHSGHWGNLAFEILNDPVGPGGLYELFLTGNMGSTPFELARALTVEDEWNRVAVVVDGTACGNGGSEPDVGCGDEVTFSLYLNGRLAGTINVTPINDPPSITSESVGTVFSSQDGTTSGLYVSSLEFHHEPLTPEMMAGSGGPNNGPIAFTDTSAPLTPGEPEIPALTVRKAGTEQNEYLEIIWANGDGSDFHLEETFDLTSGLWTPCLLPFRQAEVNGRITTTVFVDPATQGRVKFYRLRGITISYTGLE